MDLYHAREHLHDLGKLLAFMLGDHHKDWLAERSGELVKAEGIRRGADHVRQLTILGDGAAWICYPDVGIADLIPVPRLSRRSSVPA